MIRILGGIVAGMAAAITLIMVIEAIGNQIAPPPARLEMTDAGETRPLPFLTLLFPVIGAFFGALVGGFLAIKVSDHPWTAWAIAGVVLAATLFNFFLMAYPIWVIAAGVVMPVLGGWLAQRICAMANSDGASA